jgi:hypothetical protein
VLEHGQVVRRVGGTVIDNHDFEIAQRLVQDGFDGAFKQAGAIEGRDDDRDKGHGRKIKNGDAALSPFLTSKIFRVVLYSQFFLERFRRERFDYVIVSPGLERFHYL